MIYKLLSQMDLDDEPEEIDEPLSPEIDEPDEDDEDFDEDEDEDIDI